MLSSSGLVGSCKALIAALSPLLFSLNTAEPATAAENPSGKESRALYAQRVASEGRPSFNELLRAKAALGLMPELEDGGITSWEWLGPGNIGGRVRAILPLDSNTILLGSVVGGIWRSTDAGNTWVAVNDFLASLAVTCLIRDPFDNSIYAGTGEGFLVNNDRLDGTSGAGIFQSFNGGITWFQNPFTATWADDENNRFVNRIAVDGAGNMLVATNGGIQKSFNGGPFSEKYSGWVTDVKFTANAAGSYGAFAVAGLMTSCDNVNCPNDNPDQDIVCAVFSNNGGEDWDPSTFLGAPIHKLKADYNGGNLLLLDDAPSYERWDIIHVGDNSGERVQVNKSSNDTLTLRTPLGGTYSIGDFVELIPSQRTELAVVAGDPRIVYASMGAGGGTIWKSTDGGKNFGFVSNSNKNYLYSGNKTRAFYDTAIWVDPKNPDTLVVGGVELFRSMNGGVTLEQISNGRYVLPAFGQLAPHTDHHVIVEHFQYKEGLRTVYFGNDGGIHKADDITVIGREAPENSGWENLNWNLGITQFYGGAATISPTVEWFMGGGQDNGRPHLKVSGGGLPNVNGWEKPFDSDTSDSKGSSGDDKYGVAIDASDPQNPILYAAGVFLRIVKSNDRGNIWRDKWPDDGSNLTAARFAPFVLDPSKDPNIIVAGGKKLFRSADSASTWDQIRNPLSGSPNASAIDVSPSDPETYWVGYEDGTVSRTYNGRDSAPTWDDVGVGQLPDRKVMDIAINPMNRDEVFVIFALPVSAESLDTVWYTCDGGNCWEPRVGSPSYELPRIRLLSVRIHPTDSDRVYLGTDLGVLASDDRGLTWNRMPLHGQNSGPANVEVWELSWQGDYLVATTNGRGMFRTLPTVRDPLFDEVASSSGTADPGNSQGAAWGDYDDDGDLDLYVANHSGKANVLYRNEGGGNFTDVSAASGTNHNAISIGVAWGDFDNDDDLDLYVVNAGTANKLYSNDGDGTFTDVSLSSGTADTGNGRGVAWVDYNRDGNLDIYVVNFGANKLYRNEGDNTFTDVSAASGTDDSGSGQGVAWGDYDNDGDADLYVTNWSGQANSLYRNENNGTFTDLSDASGTGGSETSSSAAWGDYEDDGDLDLYVVNEGANKLYRNDGVLPLVDVSAATGTNDAGTGRGVAWGDYDNDGDLDIYVSNFLEENKLLRYEFCGKFIDVSTISGADDPAAGRAAVWGDYDEDGTLDLYVTVSGVNRLYNNVGGAPPVHHWLHVDLIGTVSNHNGIGARVRVVAGGRSQMREVSGGSGLYSQNSLTVEFGLGTEAVIDSLVVLWPSGIAQVVNPVPMVDTKIDVLEQGAVSVGDPGPTPQVFALGVAQPNPFSLQTTLSFTMPHKSEVRIALYNVAGRLVRTLLDEELGPGRHFVIWEGRDNAGQSVASGVYLYRMEAAEFVQTRRMVFLR